MLSCNKLISSFVFILPLIISKSRAQRARSSEKRASDFEQVYRRHRPAEDHCIVSLIDALGTAIPANYFLILGKFDLQ